ALEAEGPPRPGAPTAATTLRLTVREPPSPPPALRLSVAPAVVLDQGGQNRFGVVIARDGCSGPVACELGGLPPGVTTAGLSLPAEATQGEVEVGAAADAAIGTRPVSVTARGPDGLPGIQAPP